MKIVALAGGVGGAKLVYGLAQCLNPDQLSVVVNTGDDFEYLGLYISPDLDTVCYNLANINNPMTGWGRADESWNFFKEASSISATDWFHIGDRDLATHVIRTSLMKQGYCLSEIVELFCQSWNIHHRVYPMTNSAVRTIVHTADYGDLGFQEYFVKNGCAPVVKGFSFDGIENAKITAGALTDLDAADGIVICPSNPWVSIDPIIQLNGFREILKNKPVIAVSPIVNGKAIKGPAAKMFAELGIQPSYTAVAEHYRDFLNGYIFDNAEPLAARQPFDGWGIMTVQTHTVMQSAEEKIALAKEVLSFFERIKANGR